MSFFGKKEARTAAAEAPPPAVVETGARDTLTGMLSNDELVDECRNAVEAASGGEQVAIARFAFDGLRDLNAKSGNLVTDVLLRELAKRLSKTVRECDHVGRISNDEFVVVMRQLNGKLGTLTHLSRLRIALAEPITSGKGTYFPIVNYGMAHPPADGSTLEALAAAAEKSLLVMAEHTRQVARDEAVQRVAGARAGLTAATTRVSEAEQAVRDADAAFAESKKLLVDAKAMLAAALEHAKSLGVDTGGSK